MSKTKRLVAVAVVSMLAGCQEPFPAPQYAPPPPPLQPYMGPPAAYLPPAPQAKKHVVKRRYATRRRHKVHCKCLPQK